MSGIGTHELHNHPCHFRSLLRLQKMASADDSGVGLPSCPAYTESNFFRSAEVCRYLLFSRQGNTQIDALHTPELQHLGVFLRLDSGQIRCLPRICSYIKQSEL